MLAFFDDQQLEHEPGFFLSSGSRRPNPEVAERATVLKEILIQHGHELKIPKSHGMEPVAAIHTPALSAFPGKHLPALAADRGSLRGSHCQCPSQPLFISLS